VSRIAFGQISPKLYSDIAEEAAKAVGQSGGRDRNKPAQLRRFYDELLALQEKVGGDKSRFDQHEPFIQMLKAKVAYAQGRGKVDGNFASLLGRVVDQADDPDKLKQARLFMEAFMAYYKVHGPRD
jgi:CRISPR-associated protein Csm2